MKKKTTKKHLRLHRETLRNLNDLSSVRGGQNDDDGFDLTLDTKKDCSVGSCLRDAATNCM